MTQLTENVYAVEVPEGASNFKIKPHYVRNHIEERDEIKLIWDSTQITHNWLILPAGSWQFICTTKEATEEQAKGIVGSSEWYFPARHTRYIDYAHPYNSKNKQEWSVGFSGSRDSLRSLITSKGLDVSKNYALLKKG